MNYYATFGFNQSLRNCYVKVEAESSAHARQRMVEQYGRLWAFLYDEDELESCIKRWNLTEVPFGTPNVREEDE